MSNKENIEKLSNLRDEALNIIRAYNELAEKEDFDTRIGIISASAEIEDRLNEGEERPENIVKYMDDNDVRPYYGTEFPGTKSYLWKPSGINCS